MFIAALFIIARSWKEPKYLSTEEKIQNIFTSPFSWESLLSSIPIILRFGFPLCPGFLECFRLGAFCILHFLEKLNRPDIKIPNNPLKMGYKSKEIIPNRDMSND